MKIGTFIYDNTNHDKTCPGVVINQGVIDLTPFLAEHNIDDLKDLLAADLLHACASFVKNRSPDYHLNNIHFAPVIPNPGKIICVGINYHDHKVETNSPDFAYPLLFTRYPESQVGHEQPMLKPRESDKLDYEGELAVIIGKAGRRIKQDTALSHVAGYACYNDGSVRDFQRHTTQFFPGKNFVATGGFGPWMVTTEQIPDPSKLTLKTRVNGQTEQSSETKLMINSIPVLIEYISTVLHLNPGDVIVSGTPGGVGVKREPRLFMFENDTIEVEISNIGILRNTIQND